MTTIFFSIVCTTAALTPSSATYLDAELSNHGYKGWTYFSDFEEGLDRCDTESECRRVGSDGTQYLGPITQDVDPDGVSFFARVIECRKPSTLSVSYHIASCISNNGTWRAPKDHTRPILDEQGYGYWGARNLGVISGSDGELDEDILDVDGECDGTWQTQTYETVMGNVSGGCEVELKIKSKLTHDDYTKILYLYNVEIFCERIKEDINISCPDDVDGGSYYTSSGEFCVRGISNDVNGYYKMKTDEYGEDTHKYGGYIVFERDDDTTSGAKYLFEINGNQWVIGDDWSLPANSTLYAACPPHARSDDSERWLSINQCDLQYPPGSAHEGHNIGKASIAFGDCNDNAIGTFVNSKSSSSSVFGNEQFVNILLLVGVCFMCFLVGMMVCYGCQLMCYYRKKRGYRLVAAEKGMDISDDY